MTRETYSLLITTLVTLGAAGYLAYDRYAQPIVAPTAHVHQAYEDSFTALDARVKALEAEVDHLRADIDARPAPTLPARIERDANRHEQRIGNLEYAVHGDKP